MTATSFSFPSYRRLCRYLGEADAVVELTELAARNFTADAAASGDVASFVNSQSELHKVRVNLPEVSMMQKHLYRHYIVAVYQSAERFLHEFRKEHIELYKSDWVGDSDKIDPLTLAIKNVGQSEDETEKTIGLDLITRFQYYRLIRNWVVHTKGSDHEKPLAKFAEIPSYSDANKDRLALLNAPNKPTELSFDDFICFSRVTKYIAELLGLAAKPTEAECVKSCESAMKRFRRLSKNPKRLKNAIIGRLRTVYGYETGAATWLAEEILKQEGLQA